MDVETLSIRLPQEMAQLVRDGVASGAFASDSDLVQEALKLWHERAERLRAIKQSFDQAAEDPAPVPAEDLRGKAGVTRALVYSRRAQADLDDIFDLPPRTIRACDHLRA